MSDEPATVTENAPSSLYEHYCEHPGCKAWGGLGYDIGKGETKWFCYEHRLLDYRQPRYSNHP